jgi:hypothetical protein
MSYTVTVYSSNCNEIVFEGCHITHAKKLAEAYSPDREENYWVTGVSIEEDKS